MKAFVALVCLVAMVASQDSSPTPEPAPDTTTQLPSTTTEPPPPPSPPPTEPPVDCDISVGEDDWAVLLPNPASCESYYVCDAGEPIFMPCPDGLHFNTELSVCDWPDAANCTLTDEAALA